VAQAAARALVPSPPMPAESLLLMGRCGRAHGIRGELKVHPADTDDPGRFAELERVYIGPTRQEARPFGIEGVRYQFPAGRVVALLALDDVETREAAEALVNQLVYADEADLPPLADDEVYLHDLVGYEVVEVDEAGEPAGEPLGRVREIRDNAAHTLFSIARPGAPDVLLPDVPEFVLSVDTDAKRLLVRPPEGLFE